MNINDLIAAGYPKKIKGNDGRFAVLVDVQPLGDGEFAGIYRYARGECVHHISEINAFFETVKGESGAH